MTPNSLFLALVLVLSIGFLLMLGLVMGPRLMLLFAGGAQPSGNGGIGSSAGGVSSSFVFSVSRFLKGLTIFALLIFVGVFALLWLKLARR
jgi:hypothetical protein